MIFTKGDLKEVSEEVAKYKVCNIALKWFLILFNYQFSSTFFLSDRVPNIVLNQILSSASTCS